MNDSSAKGPRPRPLWSRQRPNSRLPPPLGDKTPPANPEAIPAEYLDVLNSIEKSIVSFANKAQQLSPGNKLRFRIYKAATQYTAHFSVSSLLAQLDVEGQGP